MSSRRVLLFAALSLATAAARMPAAPESGHGLSRALCASCHGVEPDDPETSFAEVPTFTAIARLPTTTSPSLHAFLSSPHGDMPDIKLKSAEMDAIVGYILSLKQRKDRSSGGD